MIGTAAGPVEQLGAQVALERPQRLGYRRLHDVERLRGRPPANFSAGAGALGRTAAAPCPRATRAGLTAPAADRRASTPYSRNISAASEPPYTGRPLPSVTWL